MGVVPSPTQPVPVDGTYLWGGYIVREYGSVRGENGSEGGGKVDAVQIEIPNAKREYNEESKSNKDGEEGYEDERERYLNELAEAVSDWIDLNYKKNGTEESQGPEW